MIEDTTLFSLVVVPSSKLTAREARLLYLDLRSDILNAWGILMPSLNENNQLAEETITHNDVSFKINFNPKDGFKMVSEDISNEASQRMVDEVLRIVLELHQ